MNLALIVLLPFLGAVLPPLMIRAGRNICAMVTGCVTASSLALLLVTVPTVASGGMVRAAIPWVPQIGLGFDLFVDGYGLFFASLILIIGLLIITYARWYLGRDDPMGRFYAYLLLFQGAMLGIALSDNVLLLLVFWELTSLSSFLLIGYWRHLAEGRQGARMALLVTGAGGLSLIAGMLLLGQAAGSYQLSEILARGELVRASPLYLPILLLVLGGAFTKSAQFPMHFWLPHAMAAPTPVSAYLHSATMVKAGIFLLGRLWPVLSGTEAWFLIVTATGLATMVIAAWIALYKDDLKALLAFSTVSHLGLVTMLFGMGTPIAAVAAVFHILNHCTFKAALFMSAGIVDHETGTRDASRLGGLLRLMPVTGTLAMVAAASMAGLPLLNGFLSKEMMLESAAHTDYLGLPWLVPALATIGALLSVAYSFRFVTAVFLGPPRDDYPKHPHDPPVGMWLPVAILVVPVVLIGVAPVLAEPLVDLAAGAVVHGALPSYHLALWHGLTPALFMTAVAVAGGLLLLAAHQPALALRLTMPRPEAKSIFDAAVGAATGWARRLTDAIHNGSLQRSLFLAVLTMLVVGVTAFLGAPHAAGERPMLPANLPALALALLVLGAGLGVLRYHRHRLLALILTSVVGLVVSLTFIYFSAPDLALTQLSVEVVTTVLMLLALNYLPQRTPKEPSSLRRWRDAAIATVGGLAIGATLYAVLTRNLAQTIASWHLAESKPGGGGTNVVNVILVDFRGYDTFGEITVLGIAGIAVLALLDGLRARRSTVDAQGRPWDHQAEPLLRRVARLVLPIALVFSVYIFWRGHNLPGGGFIAGLVTAAALVLQYMGLGQARAEALLRAAGGRRFVRWIGSGLGIACLTGLGAFVLGRPFLTSAHGHPSVPLLGELPLASAALFDLGVYVTVVGATMLMLSVLGAASKAKGSA